jgi:hypothetical protein
VKIINNQRRKVLKSAIDEIKIILPGSNFKLYYLDCFSFSCRLEFSEPTANYWDLKPNNSFNHPKEAVKYIEYTLKQKRLKRVRDSIEKLLPKNSIVFFGFVNGANGNHPYRVKLVINKKTASILDIDHSKNYDNPETVQNLLNRKVRELYVEARKKEKVAT